MRTVALLAILQVATSLALPAPEPPLLTLEQAVEIAVEDNDRLTAADASVALAEARVDQAKSPRVPRIELTSDLHRTTNPVRVFSDLLLQGRFGVDNFDPARLNSPDPINNFNARLGLTVPVWTGGEIKKGVDAARLGHDASESLRDRTRQEVVHQVIDTYTGAVLAANQLRVAREARETARANVALVSDLREAGLVVESDLLQAKLRETETAEMVIRSESAAEVALAAVNLALGRDLGTPFAPVSEIDVAQVEEESLDALIEEALAARPDLLAASIHAEAAGRQTRQQKSGYYPDIGVAGFYETNAQNFLQSDATNWTVMGNLRFTVFEGKSTSGRVRQAREQQRQAESMVTLMRRSAELQVREAFHGVRAALGLLEQSRHAVELGEESLRIVQDRYREGLTTLVDLLDAETALTRARTREVSARRDVLLSDATLKLAVGRL